MCLEHLKDKRLQLLQLSKKGLKKVFLHSPQINPRSLNYLVFSPSISCSCKLMLTDKQRGQG